MTIIKPNSIAGITSITAQGDVINVYKSDGTAAGLQLNGVNFNTTSGISTFNNLTIGGTITYQDVAHVDSVGIITAQQGIQVLANGLDITGVSTFNNNISVTGTVTATSFSGDGSSLTSVDAATLDGVDSTSFLRSDAFDTKTSGNLDFSDNVKLRFGSQPDLEIYHDGSNSHIEEVGTGGLSLKAEPALSLKSGTVNINNAANTENMARFFADGAVELYYDNTKRLNTADGGVVVTGVMTATQFSGGGIGVGIQSAGNLIGYGITTLNFVGAGNTFAINGTTVDVSIAGGGGGGGSSDGSDFNTGITSSITALPVGV